MFTFFKRRAIDKRLDGIIDLLGILATHQRIITMTLNELLNKVSQETDAALAYKAMYEGTKAIIAQLQQDLANAKANAADPATIDLINAKVDQAIAALSGASATVANTSITVKSSTEVAPAPIAAAVPAAMAAPVDAAPAVQAPALEPSLVVVPPVTVQ
jgi:hypothetical protein